MGWRCSAGARIGHQIHDLAGIAVQLVGRAGAVVGMDRDPAALDGILRLALGLAIIPARQICVGARGQVSSVGKFMTTKLRKPSDAPTARAVRSAAQTATQSRPAALAAVKEFVGTTKGCVDIASGDTSITPAENV